MKKLEIKNLTIGRRVSTAMLALIKELKAKRPVWMIVESPTKRRKIGIVIFLAVAIPVALLFFCGVGRLATLVLGDFLNNILPSVFLTNVLVGIFFICIVLLLCYLFYFIPWLFIMFFRMCLLPVIRKAGEWTGDLIFNGFSSVQASE